MKTGVIGLQGIEISCTKEGRVLPAPDNDANVLSAWDKFQLISILLMRINKNKNKKYAGVIILAIPIAFR